LPHQGKYDPTITLNDGNECRGEILENERSHEILVGREWPHQRDQIIAMKRRNPKTESGTIQAKI